MRIGLIDVDAESRGKVTFPNVPLMKIAAYHKMLGDTVEWYQPCFPATWIWCTSPEFLGMSTRRITTGLSTLIR